MPASGPSAPGWRKSSSSSNVANCVEVTFAGPAVGLRDSKYTGGPVLYLPARSFGFLLTKIRS